MPRVSIISADDNTRQSRRAAVASLPPPQPDPEPEPEPEPEQSKLCWCKNLENTVPKYDWYRQLQDGRPRCQAMLTPGCNQCGAAAVYPDGVVCDEHIEMRRYGIERLDRDHQRRGYMGFMKRVVTCDCSIVIGSDGRIRL